MSAENTIFDLPSHATEQTLTWLDDLFPEVPAGPARLAHFFRLMTGMAAAGQVIAVDAGGQGVSYYLPAEYRARRRAGARLRPLSLVRQVARQRALLMAYASRWN
jgi:hypothetical protein